jgi:ribosomal protein L15E
MALITVRFSMLYSHGPEKTIIVLRLRLDAGAHRLVDDAGGRTDARRPSPSRRASAAGATRCTARRAGRTESGSKLPTRKKVNALASAKRSRWMASERWTSTESNSSGVNSRVRG